MLIVPLLVMVPARKVALESLPMKVPVLVTPVRVAVWLDRLRMTPVPAVLSVPPMIEALLKSCTSDPVSAETVPPVFVKLPPPEPFKTRMPPLLARRVPWFTRPLAGLGSTKSESPAVFASINPPV